MARAPKSTSSNPKNDLTPGLYALWTLDVVVRLVQDGIALDFVNRPRQYRKLARTNPEILANFWYRSGSSPQYPDLHQREMILSPILGPSDGLVGEHMSEFHAVSRAVRQAADAFTNRVFSTGEDNLRAAFRDAAITFQSFLRPFEDPEISAVQNGAEQIRGAFEDAVAVLIDSGVTGVFGRPPAEPNRDWPLGESFDDNGALVIKFVSEATETTMGAVSESSFIVRQRVAKFGQRAIQGVLNGDFDSDDKEITDALIRLAYQWKTALYELNMPMGSMAGSTESVVTPVSLTTVPMNRNSV